MNDSRAPVRHVVLRHLAAGGMGELFLARAQAPGGVQRLVVLKRIREAFGEDPEFVRMFLNECRLAATLQHPNIVTVYDVGCEDGRYYYSMEYIHGEPLARILGAAERRGGLPLEHALTIVLGLTAGIAHAHQQRGLDGNPLCIIHRDLSPSNVLITYEGVIKIVDFGIARAAALTSVTPEGVRKGKAGYMSPEQAAGRNLDARSDVFAIGVLLYELTTLKRAFRGRSLFELINQVVEGRVTPPSVRVDDYPPQLEAIVMRALAPDRADRYASARELHRDLEAFANDHQLPLSTLALGEFVQSLLGERPHPTTTEVDLPHLVAGHTKVPAVPAPEPEPVLTVHDDEMRPARWPRWTAAGAALAGLIGLGVLVVHEPEDPPTTDLTDSGVSPERSTVPIEPAAASSPPPSTPADRPAVESASPAPRATPNASDAPKSGSRAGSSRRSRRRPSRSRRSTSSDRGSSQPSESTANGLLPGS